MYRKIIKYTDYNGVERKEPFYFNLEDSDLMRHVFSIGGSGSYQDYLTKLLVTRDNKEAYSIFEMFIKESYGVKSDDGKRFIKSDEVFNEFYQSRAYSEFIMELVSVPNAANEFIEGIIPQARVAQISQRIKDKNPDQLMDELLEEEGKPIEEKFKGE